MRWIHSISIHLGPLTSCHGFLVRNHVKTFIKPCKLLQLYYVYSKPHQSNVQETLRIICHLYSCNSCCKMVYIDQAIFTLEKTYIFKN